MDMRALLFVVTVSVCWHYQANGISSGRSGVRNLLTAKLETAKVKGECHYFFEPFEGKAFQGVSLYQCRQFCEDADKFQCESFMYNSIGMSCILSDTTRKLPPATSGYNNYQYFQRSLECNPVNLNDKIASCSASSEHSEGYACEKSYGDTAVATGASWAMANGKGKGEWMQVQLKSSYFLTSIDILPRCNRVAQFSSLDIHVGAADEVVSVSRTCGGTDSWYDCSGQGNAWFSTNFPHPIRTNYVKFVVTRVCDARKISIGIREMRVWGF